MLCSVEHVSKREQGSLSRRNMSTVMTDKVIQSCVHHYALPMIAAMAIMASTMFVACGYFVPCGIPGELDTSESRPQEKYGADDGLFRNVTSLRCVSGYEFVVYKAGNGAGIVQVINDQGVGVRCQAEE